MKKWQRTLLIGFIWGFIFLWWFIRSFLMQNWEFDFFKWGHWTFLLDEFKKGWIIKSTSDVIFFSTVVSSFFLFFLGWRYCLKIEWLKLMRRNINRLIYFFTGGEFSQKRTGKIQLKKNSSKNTRPRPLGDTIRPISKESEMKVPVDEPMIPGGQKPTASSSPYGASNSFTPPAYTPPADSPFNKGFNLPSMQQGFSIAPSPIADMPSMNRNWDNPTSDSFGSGSMDDILLSDIKLPERIKLEENIPELFNNAGYTVLQNAMVDGRPVEYVAISESRIIVAIEDTQPGDWLADEERFNGEDPLWFSESSHRISPVFQLLDVVKNFMERLSNNGFSGSVVPMFIERSGMIINAEDMQTTWKDLSVVVCRTDMGGPDELKSVEQSIVPGNKPSDVVIEQVQASL